MLGDIHCPKKVATAILPAGFAFPDFRQANPEKLSPLRRYGVHLSRRSGAALLDIHSNKALSHHSFKDWINVAVVFIPEMSNAVITYLFMSYPLIG